MATSQTGPRVAVKVDVTKLKGKFLRMKKGSLLDAVLPLLRAEVDRSVANVRGSLSQKWSKGGSKSGAPPRMRSGKLRDHIRGSVRRIHRAGEGSTITAQFGLFTRSPSLQAYAATMEWGAPGVTSDGTAIGPIKAKGDSWLTIFPDWMLREDGTPIFKPKSNPRAKLTAARVKNQGYIGTWRTVSKKDPANLWVLGKKAGGKPVLLWILTKQVTIQPHPYLEPERDKFLARLRSGVLNDGIREAL